MGRHKPKSNSEKDNYRRIHDFTKGKKTVNKIHE